MIFLKNLDGFLAKRINTDVCLRSTEFTIKYRLSDLLFDSISMLEGEGQAPILRF